MELSLYKVPFVDYAIGVSNLSKLILPVVLDLSLIAAAAPL
jgi:hypothetical protein